MGTKIPGGFGESGRDGWDGIENSSGIQGWDDITREGWGG